MTNTIEKSDETMLKSQDEEIKTTSELDKIKESSELDKEDISQEDNQQVQTSDIQIDKLDILSPGSRLRQLREQNNVSIKHVADRLFLDIRVIEKIEADDYENLPPLIFIRGYMRNYAKLLDVKPESILDAFDPDSKQPKLRPPMKRKEQASRHDPLHVLGTVVVIIILLVLAAMWQYPETPPILPETGPSIPIEPVEPIEPDLTIPVPKPEEIVNNSQNNVNEEVEENNVEPIAEIIPLVNDKTIKVYFKARAWMRITDKTKASLYEGISNKGKVLSRDGTPPFYLKVGNIDGINIEYKGEIKDIKEYPKRKGQRNLFIVGDES
ncbi:MAG TPA: helix-turn-helix domain-containing protein [Thioploca sp.]|nr:helix-turn-helix domain-containing protein [Thioploca sp.]